VRSSFNSACSAAALLLCLLPALASAAGAAEVTHVSGVCIVRKADGSSKVLAPKTAVEQGDVVITAQNAYVRLKFSDGGEVTLRPNTQLRIARYHFEPDKPQEDSLIFGLLKGGLRTITGFVGKRKERSYELQTTTSTIGVRGTGLGVLSCQAGDCEGLQTVDGQVPKDGTHVDVFEGRVEVANQGGTLLVAAGEFAYVPSFAVAPIRVPRADAVPMPVPNFDAPPPGSGLDSGCVVR
jgi:hypothetical protein